MLGIYEWVHSFKLYLEMAVLVILLITMAVVVMLEEYGIPVTV